MPKPFLTIPTLGRFLQAAVVGVLVSILAAVVGTPLVFDRWIGSDSAVSILTAEISGALHRQVKIADARFNWWQGLVLSNVEMSQHSTFRDGLWLSARQASLRPSFWQLLQGKLRIRRVVLHGLTAQLKRNNSGQWNFEHLVSSCDEKVVQSSSTVKSSSSVRPKISLNIDAIEVYDAQINIQDEERRLPSLTLREFDAQIREILSDRPFEAEFVGWFDVDWDNSVKPSAPWIRVLTKNPLRLDARVRGQILRAGPEGPWIEIGRLKTESLSWDASIKSRINPLALSGFAEAQISAKPFDILISSRPLHFLGDALLRVDASRQDRDWAFEVDLDAGSLETSWGDVWNKKSGVFLKAHSKAQWREVSLPVSTDTMTQDSILTHLDERSPHYLAQGDLTLRVSSAPENSVANWVIGWHRQSQGGLKPAASKTRWEVALSSVSLYPQGWPAAIPGLAFFSMDDGGARVQEFSAWGASGFWTASVNGLAAEGSGIEYKGDRIGSMKAGFGRVIYSQKSKNWSAGFDGAAEFKNIKAKLIYCRELGAQGHLDGLANEKDPSINGLVSVYMTNGALTNVPEMVHVAPFMKFLVKPLQIVEDLNAWGVLKLKNQDFTSLTMESMQSNYRFDNGKMSLDPVSLKGPVANVHASGGIDFPKDYINLVIAVQILQERSRLKLADAFSDDSGNPFLHIKVKGPLGRPDVYPVLGPKKDMLKELDIDIQALKKTASKVLKGLVPSWLKKAVSR